MKIEPDGRSEASVSGDHAAELAPAANEVLCACIGLHLGEYQELIATEPQISFEQILTRTGAGITCTACLLDLEYHFVAHPRSGQQVRSREGTDYKPVRSLKRRLYDFLDRISPPVRLRLLERLPVIVGPDIDQRIWVSNRSLMFEGERSAPPMEVLLTVRDDCGHVRHRHETIVEPESSCEFVVSDYLPQPLSTGGLPGLTVGSVEIERRATKPGVRGTTRPQTEIIARNGTCSVHSQAYKLSGSHGFSFFHDPADQRVFASFVNFRDASTRIVLEYPIGTEAARVKPQRHEFEIPALGAALHEIEIDDRTLAALKNRHVVMQWTVDGEYNCHFFCATPDLSVISIDHA